MTQLIEDDYFFYFFVIWYVYVCIKGITKNVEGSSAKLRLKKYSGKADY